jgi:DNA-binding transcriptional LysR family regulator
MVREDLRARRLKWLMPEAASHEDGLFLYFPRRQSMAPKLRAFVESARAIASPTDTASSRDRK